MFVYIWSICYLLWFILLVSRDMFWKFPQGALQQLGEAHWSLIRSPPCSESLNQSSVWFLRKWYTLGTSLSVPFCVFCWNGFFFLNSIFWHAQEFHPLFVSIHTYPQVTSSVCRFNFYLYTDSSWHIHSSSLSL